MEDGSYGSRKRIEGKLATVRMDPQPGEVICVHREYTKLARQLSYERRVTYVDGMPCCLVEYLGIFPEHIVPHGNATKSTAEYVRTKPRVMEELAQTCRTSKDKPRSIYQSEQLGADEQQCPRNRKQVENVAAAVSSEGKVKSSANLADELQTLLSRLSSPDENFVQQVQCLLGRSPSVVLFTQQQIDDVKQLCCDDAPPHLKSVFAVDRTFNLSSLYVTVTVFKHKKLQRISSQEPPVFIGPMMLHGDGKFQTYLNFFSTVSGAMNEDDMDTTEVRLTDSVITGSDEETALVRALRRGFPNSKQLFCMLHCKDNVRHHLTAIGTAVNVREHILALVFGSSGVAEASSDDEMDDRTAQVMQYVRQQNVNVVDYLQNRIMPKIHNNCRLRWDEPWIGQQQWSNNNCESANHMLKMQVLA